MSMTTQTDQLDEAILRDRMAAMDKRKGPRVGDYVRFADDALRRISYHWTDGTGWDGGCQTSDAGSYYLGDGYVSMSGALYTSVPTESLTLTEERKEGAVWFFHHDYHRAHNGVHFAPEFRVYSCSEGAPAV